MQEYDVAEVYRQIGTIFRENGAERVILLRSRKHTKGRGMSLELAADGWLDQSSVQSKCQRLWPDIDMKILDLNEADAEFMNEVLEDGIIL